VLNKLNLGSGSRPFKDHVNVDVLDRYNPDICWDLNTTPYTWAADNHFEFIAAYHILEHLDPDPKKYLSIISELYRISKHGATWHIMIPHHASDDFINDPTHTRAITAEQFFLFDQVHNLKCINKNAANSTLGLDLNIDLEITQATNHMNKRITDFGFSEKDLEVFKLFGRNICTRVEIFITIHKPCRVSNANA
jgi:hypothetical protein